VAARRPRLVLADDHTLILEALECLLVGEFEIVGTASDGGALVALVPGCQPEVVILDLTMPVLSGLEVLRALVPTSPNTRFIVLTMHTDRGYVREAFAAGAHGYLMKGASPEELSDAVWAVLRGERVIGAQLGVTAASLVADAGSPTRGGSGALTERQREVLQRVAAGLPCKRIAAELAISVKTVEFHKASISRQLGLKSTAALTRWAIAHGLVAPLAGDPPRAPAASLVFPVVPAVPDEG
jgi:DNA-binding NarL/FixJ family response regulator